MRTAKLANESADGLAERRPDEVELTCLDRPVGMAAFAVSTNGRFSDVHRGFGATTQAIHEFVNSGTSSFRFAQYCGCGEDDLQDLRGAISREGAIGLLFGLCLCPRE